MRKEGSAPTGCQVVFAEDLSFAKKRYSLTGTVGDRGVVARHVSDGDTENGGRDVRTLFGGKTMC